MADVSRRRADWSNLRVFFAVAETGGINAAARALRLNPSTVTRAIEELEYQLKVTLLNRSSKGITLTKAGEIAYQRVLTMDRAVGALELEVVDTEALPDGRLKLAAPDGLATYFITPYIHGLVRAHPGIDLCIDCGLWPDRPLEGEADLTLTFAEPAYADAVATPVAHLHWALFASREYVNLFGAPKTPQEVLLHPYVHHVAQVYQQEGWSEWAHAFQTLTRKRIETNSSAVVIEAIRNGTGIGALPTAILSFDPTLIMLDVPPLAPGKLWLVHHREATRLARVRLVADWLKGIFDPRTRPWYSQDFVHPRDFALSGSDSDTAQATG